MNKTPLTQRWEDAIEIITQAVIAQDKTRRGIPTFYRGTPTQIAFYLGVISAVEFITQGTTPEALLAEAREKLENPD